ncbi:MAG: protein translocase subunit SecD, partial [Desulfonatronovibrionaceae bacterium]
MGGLRWRIILILIVLICGLVYVFPSIPQVRDSSLGEKLPDDQINLGLDLKGGIHLTLGVGVEEAVENALAQNGRDIRSLAREQDVFVLRPDVKDSDTLQFTLLKEDKQKILDGLLADDFPELEVTAKNREGEGKIRYSLKYTQEALKELQSMTIDQAV